MDGESLIQHLRSLGVPGAENLEGADYDWLFHSQDTAPLATFLQWFMKNVSARDVLTETEIKEYEELETKGEVLSGGQLEEMEACLSGLSSALAPSHDYTQPPLSPQQRDRLQDQLQLLNNRKNHLSLHKMELREELRQVNEAWEEAENELRKQQEGLLLTSHHHHNLKQEFTKELDDFVNVYRNFDEAPAEEAWYLSQLSLNEWHEEETKYTQTLKAYIRKQFSEGVRTLAGEDDGSEYCLLEPGNLELHLIRGEAQQEYIHNIQELDRVTKLLRQTEEWRAEGVILQARRKAQIEEANRALAAIQANQYPTSLPLLEQQVEESRSGASGVKAEVEEQWRVVVGLVGEVAQLEAATTISGNYQLKLQRQAYFLDRQNIVLNQLISQVARYNWVNISLSLERETIRDILQLLQSFNELMVNDAKSYKERMIIFEDLRKEYEEGKASGHLPKPLQTLSNLLPKVQNPREGEGIAGIKKQLDMLYKSLSVTREQVLTAKNPQFSRLNRMTGNCESLETSLFGNSGSLRTLPIAWLNPDLADRCGSLDNDAWRFKLKILDLMKQYEAKQKILQVDPTAREDVGKWTARLVKELNEA